MGLGPFVPHARQNPCRPTQTHDTRRMGRQGLNLLLPLCRRSSPKTHPPCHYCWYCRLFIPLSKGKHIFILSKFAIHARLTATGEILRVNSETMGVLCLPSTFPHCCFTCPKFSRLLIDDGSGTARCLIWAARDGIEPAPSAIRLGDFIEVSGRLEWHDKVAVVIVESHLVMNDDPHAELEWWMDMATTFKDAYSQKFVVNITSETEEALTQSFERSQRPSET